MTDRTRDTAPRRPHHEGGDEGVQAVLPLDLHPDEPVPFRLTPKARRVVAPDTLPTLEVVAPPAGATGDRDGSGHAHEVPVDLDDPHDPRSARARALRRGGMSVVAIAQRLDVDELAVRTWTGDLDLRGRRRLRAVRDVPAAPAEPASAPDTTTDDRLARHHAAFVQARRQAADEVGPRMADPAFVRGLALTVAAAELDEHAVLVALRDRDVASMVRDWLVRHAEVGPRDLRVVVRLGATAGADLVLHRWAEALDLSPERLARTRWRSAPSEDAVEVLLRIPDARVAARIAGWRDALLGVDDLGGLPTGVGF